MMNPSASRSLSRLLYFSGILALAGLIASAALPDGTITPALPWLIVFFTGITWFSVTRVLRSAEGRFAGFVNAFLLSIVIKLFLYAGILIAYALLNRGDAVPFMLAFFILYLGYTVFESVSVVRSVGPGARKTGQ